MIPVKSDAPEFVCMKIVVMVDGNPKGPFELDALKTEVQEGRIAPADMAA